MKKIGRIAALTMALSMSISLTTTSAYAAEASMTTAVAAATTETISLIYEQSVIMRTLGRAGADAITGAKGIVLEVLYTDKQNMNILTKIIDGASTSLSKSSTDTVADIITTNRKGLEKMIQCKDAPSTSGISQVIEQVRSGKYSSTELVGTTECAAQYNQKALEQGLQPMMDSGISTERTAAIAAKKLGTTTYEQIAKKAIKGGKGTAIFAGVFALGESLYNDDSLAETISNVSVEVGNGAVIGYVSTFVGESALLAVGTVAGTTSAVATIVPVAVTFGSAVLLYYVVDTLEEHFEIKEVVADKLDVVVEATSNFANTTVDKAKKVGNKVADKVAETKEEINDYLIDEVNNYYDKRLDTVIVRIDQ